MNIPKNKFIRKASAFLFSAVFIGLVAIPTAYAVDYSGISEDRIKYVVKQSGWLDILRIVLWKILVGCAELIDGIYQAINKLLEVNIYDLWIKNIPFFSSGVGKIAAALAGMSIIFAAIYLVAFHDKIRHLDIIRSIIIAGVVIIALPAMIACLNDLRSTSTKVVTNIAIDGNNDPASASAVPKTIGQILLGSVTYRANTDNGAAQVDLLTELYGWDRMNPYSIDINQVNPNYEWKDYPTKNAFMSTVSGIKRFDMLNIENKMLLLGCYEDYMLFQKIMGTDDTVSRFNGTTDQNGVKQYDHLNEEQLSKKIINHINYVCGTSLPDSTSVVNAVFDEAVEDKLIELNYINNQNVVNTGESVFDDEDGNQYQWVHLKDSDDQEKADTSDLILGAIRNLGTYQEYVYSYDCDFFYAYVIVIATLISLIYAGFRLASLLYDVMFVQIIAPLFIVTDMHGTGRAKKVINNLVNTNIVIIVVLALIKIYLICAVGIVSSSLDFVVKLFLLMGGVKFLIDGPDLVTRLLGIDAGVKNGAASAIALTSAARMGLNAARTGTAVAGTVAGTVARAAGTAVNAGQNVANGIARAPDAVRTAVNNAQEHRWERQAEKAARNEAGLSRTEYRDIKRDAAKQERADRKASAKQERFDRASAAGQERFESIYSNMYGGGGETSATSNDTAQAPAPAEHDAEQEQAPNNYPDRSSEHTSSDISSYTNSAQASAPEIKTPPVQAQERQPSNTTAQPPSGGRKDSD